MATVNISGSRTVNDFVAQVRARLRERNMTITDLAKKAKVTRPYIQRVLAGDQIPTLATAEKIGKPLGLKVTTTAG